MSEAIEVSSLVKCFGNLNAVNGISFKVKTNELFAFLGPNGAGKSTTVNILCTLLKKDSGSVRIGGMEVGEDDCEIRRKIGVVFQENCLDNRLTVRQNLISRASLYENSREKVLQSLSRVSSFLDIGDLLNRPFGKLSGGQKRKCEIARSVMNYPEILFLDEPTTGLDPQTRHCVWECINTIRKEQGTTVFFSTHYMEEATGATNVAVINKGEISAMGSPSELRERYSSDMLRVASGDWESTRSVFLEMNIKYKERADVFHVEIPNSLKALDILKALGRSVTSFEVVHGTMDDAFMNITGRTLRED